MQDMTMGQIIGYAKDARLFNEDAICELEYILDKRNYLAHQFFKKNDIVKYNFSQKGTNLCYNNKQARQVCQNA